MTTTLVSARHIQTARTIAGRTVTGVLLLFCLVSLLLLLVQVSYLFTLGEGGYGDSYVLYDVLHFQKTGIIYRDLSQPPYVPVLYSPMVYMLYSLPGRIAVSANPFVGPRLITLASFVFCVAIVISIVRALVPGQLAWLWAALLACSISIMWDWLLQIRSDFPGIFFSLLAIRLLLARFPGAVLLAGICAGLALQFKITFVAALAAGALWLLLWRRWRDLAGFLALGTISSVGLYALFAAREPRMWSQIFVLSRMVPDVPGSLKLIYRAVREPVVLLAVLGVSSIGLREQRGFGLLGIFAITSFGGAALTDIQAGGNVNYFYEALFALIPLATLGVLRATALARRRIAVGMFLTVLFALHFIAPRATELYATIRERRASSVQASNAALRDIERALDGYRVFSTVPRLALLDSAPALTEPYLFSYLQRLGEFDAGPLLDRIRNEEFDVVITPRTAKSWRGVPQVAPNLTAAISASYKAHCIAVNSVLHLPRRQTPHSSALAVELPSKGCMPIPSEQAAPESRR